MSTEAVPLPAQDRRTLLSTAWIFLAANYIFCDVLSLMEPSAARDLLAGRIGSIQVNQGFLLASAVLMEIPFAMIILTRLLAYRPGRWANLGSALLMALVQVATLNLGTGLTLHYLFFSAVEISCALAIAWTAWSWRPSA